MSDIPVRPRSPSRPRRLFGEMATTIAIVASVAAFAYSLTEWYGFIFG